MLGTDLCPILEERHEVVPLGRVDADVTDLEALLRAFREHQAGVVIHAAAETDVDGCEGDPDHAYRVNGWGAWAAATAAEAVGARFVLISMDFVFDGESDRPYTEFDPVHPISVYGTSKLAGEEAAQRACRRCTIVRTQWLYGRNGASFPRAILKAASGGGPLQVVADQVGSPTYTRHFAQKLRWLIEQRCDGVYHFSNSGAASRWEWACEILRLAGHREVEVQKARTSEFPRPARRPAYSVLRHLALEMRKADDIPAWQDGLSAFIDELKAAGEVV